MPVDSSIYSQMQAPDFLGQVTQGLSMRNMLDQRKMQQDDVAKQKAISNAYAEGMSTDANGNVSFDGKKTVATLAGIDGKAAYTAQNDIRTQEAADLKAKHERAKQTSDFFGSVRGQVKDQASYDQAMTAAKAQGLDPSAMPPQWGPEAQQKIDFYHGQALSVKDQIEADARKRGLDIQQQNANTEARKASTGAATRQDGLKQKYADSLKKDLDPDAGRTGNFGTISKTLISADKLQQLMAQHPDGNLDPRQMEDYALGLANMLSGGSGAARSQVEALVPHTLMGKAVNVQEWLTNEPKGAEQQAFVKRMNETVQRERELAANQLNQIREQRLSSHRQYAKADPEGFKAQLQSYGLDPNNYDANLLPIKKAGPPPPKFDHLSDDELTKLYKAHGGR